MDYTAVIPVLVQAVKELDATIQQLELQLDEKANLSDLQNNKNLTSKSLLSNAVMNQNTPNPFNSTRIYPLRSLHPHVLLLSLFAICKELKLRNSISLPGEKVV